MIELMAVFIFFVFILGRGQFEKMDRRDRLAAKHDLDYRSIDEPSFGLMVAIGGVVLAFILIGA